MSQVHVWQNRMDLHRQFLRDDSRNNAYAAAIARAVKPGMTVLDVGSGTGVWACVAARAGAKRVVAVEFSDIVEQTRITVKRNGFEGIVEVLHADILELKLDERFDLVIHELIGGLLYEEDMITMAQHVRRHFLAPGGRILPPKVDFWLSPWSLPNDRPLPGDWKDPVVGLDFAHLYEVERDTWSHTPAASCIHELRDESGRLGAAIHAQEVDLETLDALALPIFELPFVATRSGTMTGMLGYFEIKLDAESSIKTSPLDAPTNWGQVYVRLQDTVDLVEGARYVAVVETGHDAYTWRAQVSGG